MARNDWTQDELAILGSGLPTVQLVEMLPNRSRESIVNKRQITFGKKYTLTHFSQDEIEYFKKRVGESVPLEQISNEIKEKFGIRRTLGSLQQMRFKLKLHRDGRRTRLVAKYGEDVLKLGQTVEEINGLIKARERAAKDEDKSDFERRKKVSLELMQGAIFLGTPKRIAYQQAMIDGCTLQDIGNRMGVSRERIRQVVDNIKPGHYVKIEKPKKAQPFVQWDEKKGLFEYGWMTIHLGNRSKDKRVVLGSTSEYTVAADLAAKLNEEGTE